MGVQLQATSFQSELTIKQIVRLYAGLYGLEITGQQITDGLREIGLDREARNRSSSSPAASSSDSPCTSPSSTTRRCCCSTSRPPGSTRSRAASSGPGSSTCDRRAGASC